MKTMSKHPNMKQVEETLEKTVQTAESVGNVIRLADAQKAREQAAQTAESSEAGLDPYSAGSSGSGSFVICPECGSLVPSEYDSFLSQEEADKYALEHCECQRQEISFNVFLGIWFTPAPNNRPDIRRPVKPEPITLGACRFCGQAQSLPIKSYDPDEANEYATLHCKCSEALRYRDAEEAEERRNQALEEVNENLSTLFGDDIKSDETMELLKAAAAQVYDKTIVSYSLKLTYTIAAKISRNAKGNISIERKDATAQKIEV